MFADRKAACLIPPDRTARSTAAVNDRIRNGGDINENCMCLRAYVEVYGIEVDHCWTTVEIHTGNSGVSWFFSYRAA
jgi:hypothetical protein